MIPSLVDYHDCPWSVLPAGIHTANLDEVQTVFGVNDRRRDLFQGFIQALLLLRSAGCVRVWLNGSYVTTKPNPQDYDACWDPDGVDLTLLSSIILDLSNGTAQQKERFGGEFFPSTTICSDNGKTFLDFFQYERHSGRVKGIIEINIEEDLLLNSEEVYDSK